MELDETQKGDYKGNSKTLSISLNFMAKKLKVQKSPYILCKSTLLVLARDEGLGYLYFDLRLSTAI